MKKPINIVNVLCLLLFPPILTIKDFLCPVVYAADLIKQVPTQNRHLATTAKKNKKLAKSVTKFVLQIAEPPLITNQQQSLIEPEMVLITGGCFQEDIAELENTPKVSEICLKNFHLGKYEVTQAQWQAVMEDNPSHFIGDNLPVERVSWKDAQNFIVKLNAKTGKIYRLPNENEWFFACQAGSHTDYCGSDNLDAVGWYYNNSDNTTHAVGKKAANAWGLYDMSGNVMEWVMNTCDQTSCSGRGLRGGSWQGLGSKAGSVIRFNAPPNYRFDSIGFRLALDP